MARSPTFQEKKSYIRRIYNRWVPTSAYKTKRICSKSRQVNDCEFSLMHERGDLVASSHKNATALVSLHNSALRTDWGL